MVPTPPPATGHSSGGGRTPADSRPRAIAAATTGARRPAPKASGATSTGGWASDTGGILSRMAAKRALTTLEAAGHEIRLSTAARLRALLGWPLRRALDP